MRKLIFLFITLFLVLNPLDFNYGAIPASERAALISLYKATAGDNWKHNDGWKTPPLHSDGFAVPGTEGNWYGITLNNNRVTKISLYLNYLRGKIPPAIGTFTNLTELVLTSNSIWGTIPSELGSLVNLKRFIMSNTQVSGSIPPELGNLRNLEQLDLSYSRLTGPIPKVIGNLTHLKWLELNNNNLSGSIPKEMGKLINLLYIDLSCNKLSGQIPYAFKNLINLEYLYLNSNHLSGNIPGGFCDFHNLWCLELSYNWLQGSIPPGLGNLEKLGYLYLDHNQLKGEIPPELSNLKNLYELKIIDIRYNCLYTKDSNLINWLNIQNPDWDEYQNQCDRSTLPFGTFDSPGNYSRAAGSIAVTGWALDDTVVESVKIYREDNSGLIYIGDADFYLGARPDIAEAYPGYLNSSRAGWGYLMLTNLLPNNGNGTFKIKAIARDMVGRSTILGTKIIFCDNANSRKPFGTIDIPKSYGVILADGYDTYTVWGWALAPKPNSIPLDGSTITVWVDGLPVGNPVYNIYRKDIAEIFPGYNNSQGAGAYFQLDITPYKLGKHTLAWSVTDDAGNTAGIGSRVFYLWDDNNSPTSSKKEINGTIKQGQFFRGEDIAKIPDSYPDIFIVRTGFNNQLYGNPITFDEKGIQTITIKQITPVEIQITEKDCQMEGYLLIGNRYSSLPLGTTIKNGTFYWLPEPGFWGKYRFVFIIHNPEGDMCKKELVIIIK